MRSLVRNYSFNPDPPGAEKNVKKSNNRSAAFQTKKNALISNARKEADEMVREGSAYMCVFYTYPPHRQELLTICCYYCHREQCKLNIEQLRSQETQSDNLIKEAVETWIAQEVSPAYMSCVPTMNSTVLTNELEFHQRAFVGLSSFDQRACASTSTRHQCGQ